ncbi:hypothetical protein CR970_02100 [Candidatus Saccharibacteria bacterium]|nr:MAG: hypothetical protein CR970_02100 [Candidatus Saccharibacteria bacterium]
MHLARLRNTSRNRVRHDGFTIIELMIATLVFAVILLVLTTALLRVGYLYYKGLSSSKVQEISRSVMEDISQSIQFAGGDVFATIDTGSAKGYCVGSTRYSYDPFQAYTVAGQHKLVADSVASGCVRGVTAARTMTDALSGNARELLSEDMRVVKLSIEDTATPGLYKVSVRIAYGKDDVLISPTGPGLIHDDLQCKNNAVGTQFCAVSESTAYVQRRVQ